jgi:hypothetical protein
MILLLIVILLIFGTGHGFYSGWNPGNGGLVGVLVIALVLYLLLGQRL